MSNLKPQWLTISEATERLSKTLGETVTEANMLKFALSGDLKLSVNFVNDVKAKSVTFTGIDGVLQGRLLPEDVEKIIPERLIKIFEKSIGEPIHISNDDAVHCLRGE